MTRHLTTTLATLTIALLLFTAGMWYGTARTLSRVQEHDAVLAENHTERDAYLQVHCAMANVAWMDWRDLAGRAVEAQYGPFTMESGE